MQSQGDHRVTPDLDLVRDRIMVTVGILDAMIAKHQRPHLRLVSDRPLSHGPTVADWG
jgi:hypothetical protein